LSSLYPGWQKIPDICVPSCARQNCPINFHCQRDAGPGYLEYCVPGLPGYRCVHDDDCMLGYCLRIDSDVSVCTVDCDSDELCSLLDPLRDPFLCVRGVGADPSLGVCLGYAVLGGAPCADDAECPQALAPHRCSSYDPFSSEPRSLVRGNECHRICDADGSCPSRGGIPHACLPNGECYPGVLGVPCRRAGRGDCMDDPACECMGNLSCECIEGCDQASTDSSTRICTFPCESDADCLKNRLAAHGVCLGGFCRRQP
jgi:hypothetical protein